ncbi:hypothetical protein D3C80_1597150 [compost metagenome]
MCRTLSLLCAAAASKVVAGGVYHSPLPVIARIIQASQPHSLVGEPVLPLGASVSVMMRLPITASVADPAPPAPEAILDNLLFSLVVKSSVESCFPETLSTLFPTAVSILSRLSFIIVWMLKVSSPSVAGFFLYKSKFGVLLGMSVLLSLFQERREVRKLALLQLI